MRQAWWWTLLLPVTLIGLGGACGSGPETDDLYAAKDVQAGDAPVSRADQEADERVAQPAEVDYLVVSADSLLPTAQAFADYRSEQGYKVALVTLSDLASAADVADEWLVAEIASWVRDHYDSRAPERPLYLLLVGDAVEEGNDRAIHVPAGFWPGGWQGCYSDNLYADMDYDHVPDLAVGRLPVTDNETGLDLLARIEAHENEYAVGLFNRRLNLYAGEGGFGEGADALIETVAQKGLETVPYEYEIKFAYHSGTSHYFYQPFEDIVQQLVTGGALLVTYMGHGGGELDVPSLAGVVMEKRQPMITWFACSTGPFMDPTEPDSEEVLEQPGGPMNALVSSATTHPYANAVNALEIEAAVFVDQPETIGEAVRLMKWRSLYATSEIRDMMDELAPLYMPEEDMILTVEDHMYSYNLLGDPATRIQFPRGKAEVSSEPAFVGQEFAFSGSAEGITEGTAHVELVCERAAIIHPLTPITDPWDEAEWPAIQQNWEAANDNVAANTDVTITDGQFSGTLLVPAGTPTGQYYLAVYADDGTVDAVGSVPVQVKK